MKILISNDDGIMATGIRALTQVLSASHDVYVIAPDRERSAAGHSLTLHTPLRVEELEPKFGVKRNWVTTGTPGDCVKIGLNVILGEDEKPDFILSGINHGPNLGADILYSGTVSCAMEAAMMGYPGIAISLASLTMDENYFYYAAKFISKFLPKLAEIQFPEKTILNVNFPALYKEDILGVEITTLGTRMFTDTYEKRIDPRGKTYYWMAGELIKQDLSEDSDITAIMQNKISITPITFDMTNRAIMNDLKKAFCKDGKSDWY